MAKYKMCVLNDYISKSKNELGKFDFARIKAFLNAKCNEFCNKQEASYSSIKTNDVIFCGLGLIRLGETENAGKLYDLLQKAKINDNAWGIYLSSQNPNILQTFYGTMLCN